MTQRNGTSSRRAPCASIRQAILLRIGTILFGLILAVVAAEVALRAFPEALLGADLTSALYDPYNTTPLGIYFREPRAQMNVMWPSAELKAYSHGYFWTHRTDARGFRNPEGRRDPEILLLGDSVIYGHGLEEDQTAASFLRRDRGHPVYNMARQGDCLYEQYRLLRLYLDELSPRTVLLFAFSNDLADLAKTDAFARADRPPEIDEYDYAAIRRSIERIGGSRPEPPFASRFLLARLVAGARGGATAGSEAPGKGNGKRAAFLLALQKRGLLPKDGKALELAQAKRLVALPEVRARLDMGWRRLDPGDLAFARLYYRQILRDLHARCRARGARLVLVNLALDQGEYWRASVDRNVADMTARAGFMVSPAAAAFVAGIVLDARVQMVAQVGSVVAEAAGDDGIDYLDLSAHFLSADNYLEGDGHLSETGQRKLAEHLHAFLSLGPQAARTGSR